MPPARVWSALFSRPLRLCGQISVQNKATSAGTFRGKYISVFQVSDGRVAALPGAEEGPRKEMQTRVSRVFEAETAILRHGVLYSLYRLPIYISNGALIYDCQ